MIDIPSNGFQNGHSITFIRGHGDGVLRDEIPSILSSGI